MTEGDVDLKRMVERDGWVVVAVPETDRTPDYVHSVGLFRTFGHPEIIVLGLPLETAEEIIGTLGEAIADGQKFTDSVRSSEVLEGYDVLFRSVAGGALPKYFAAAIDYYGGRDFSAVQCIWPDSAGRYPGEPRTRPGFSKLQPILWSA